MDHQALPYGSWPSALDGAQLAANKRLNDVCWDSHSDTLVWLEGHGKRGVLMFERPGSVPTPLTSEAISVRAEVGYGGGDFCVHNGVVFFVQKGSGQLFRQGFHEAKPYAITPVMGSPAAPVVSPDGRWVVYVRHDEDGTDGLFIVDSLGTQTPQELHQGHDFYMQPTWSPDGKKLAWVSWDHPNMPWDASQLLVADVEMDAGPTLRNARVAAGGTCAVFQPQFNPRNPHQLFYVSDRDGWNNLWCMTLPRGEDRCILGDDADYGMPGWVQNMRTFALHPNGRDIIAARNQQGTIQLVVIDSQSGERTYVSGLEAYGDITQIALAPGGDALAFLGSHPQTPPHVVRVQLSATKTIPTVVSRAATHEPPRELLSDATALSWSNAQGHAVHGLFLPPRPGVNAPVGTLPPLIVIAHGGPTAQTRRGWHPQAQYFSSRGFAVLLPNPRGSTGYGRDYMQALNGGWGDVDTTDVIAGAQHLIDTEQVDAQRIVAMGSSAGGFTALHCLIQAPNIFCAGSCSYAVIDLEALTQDTHKFEAHYNDVLLGPWPEAKALYEARSPLTHATRIQRPLALFQGSEDPVVPMSQADALRDAMQQTGTPLLYRVYEGEGHGFRKAESLRDYYKNIDSFLKTWVVDPK